MQLTWMTASWEPRIVVAADIMVAAPTVLLRALELTAGFGMGALVARAGALCLREIVPARRLDTAWLDEIIVGLRDEARALRRLIRTAHGGAAVGGGNDGLAE